MLLFQAALLAYTVICTYGRDTFIAYNLLTDGCKVILSVKLFGKVLLKRYTKKEEKNNCFKCIHLTLLKVII